ncbi:MAG: 30S ribosomal protein S6 [Smithellaceae bacterium]|nr:30S ribosomal protein S6 [Smithellaceae bacterium]
MKRYETLFIVVADLPDDEMNALLDRYRELIASQKGVVVKIELWGKRKLAYLIRKQSRGFYVLADYAGGSITVSELERNLKIDDKVLKFITVLKADSVDLAEIEKEIAAAAEQAAPAPEKKIEPPPAEAEKTVAVAEGTDAVKKEDE